MPEIGPGRAPLPHDAKWKLQQNSPYLSLPCRKHQHPFHRDDGDDDDVHGKGDLRGLHLVERAIEDNDRKSERDRGEEENARTPAVSTSQRVVLAYQCLVDRYR